MPLYKFNCECGLQFERLTKDKVYKCPNCGKEVSRSFMNKITPVMVTGVPAESIDKAVGRDSDKRWNKYNDRFLEKQKVRDESGQFAMSAVTKEDGTLNYKPTTKEEIQQRVELNKILKTTKIIEDI